MTKQSAAWLVVRTLGVLFLFYAILEWIEAVSQILVYLKYRSAEEILHAHLDSQIATVVTLMILELAKAIGATVVCVYLLKKGERVHRLLMLEH